MKVMINAGHAPNGIPDPGAIGCGLRECDVTATVAHLVEGYLKAAGCAVKYIQSDSLCEISSASNDWGADVFLSIHCNSASTDQARGVETFSYYGSGNGKLLAACIQNQIIDAFQLIDPDFPNRGLKEAGYHVIRATDAPAVLVELAFINNVEDAALLKYHGDDFARAVARGVTDYECECCVDKSTK